MTRFTLSSLSLLAVLLTGCYSGDSSRPSDESGTTGDAPDCNAAYEQCVDQNGSPAFCAPKYNAECDAPPTTGVDTDTNPTTDDMPTTGVDTDDQATGGTDGATGGTDNCQLISCQELFGALPSAPDGVEYTHQPNCDDGLQAREVLDIVIESYQKQFPWLTACYDGDLNDLKGVANWLNLEYDGDDQADATSCLLSDMLAYEGRPILFLKSDLGGNYGLGETEKVVSDFCFSGAKTEDNQRHIDKVSVVSLFSELPSNVTVRLQCDGDEYSVVLEDSSDVVDVDCSMPSGVAGSLHLEVDIAEQGGQVGDQFRLEILGALVSDGYQMHVAGANLAPLWTLQ